MKVWIFILLLVLVIVLASFNHACPSNFRTHAIECAMIGEQKICFVREVWGFNGDKVSLTTTDNVCHKPSKETDYVSNTLRGEEQIFAKIADGKFYIYAEPMDAPEKPFPVEVVIEKYNPATWFDRDFIKDGYQEFDLSKKNMTWCFNDIF